MIPAEAKSRRSGVESRPGKPARRSRVSRAICALALAPILVTCSGSTDSTTTAPGNDAVTQAVGPAGGTVVTPSGAAGVQIPAGTFSQQVMVTITRLPAPGSPGAGPLPSSLKQYGPYYDFTTSPQVAQFGDSARVGVCQVTDPSSAFYPPEPHDRLRLAHTVGTSIEILDRVGVNDFLRCTNVSASRSTRTDGNGLHGVLLAILDNAIGLLRPADLYAAHGGLGGKVKSFSPFGAVDPAVATVTVTLASPTVGVGSSIQATAVLKDADGNVLTGRVVTWTSSNVAVATVSSSGLVTGVAAGGPVTITATSEGQSGTGAVTITVIPVASVTVSPGSSTVNVGATVQLTATTKDANGNVLTGRVVTWTTNNAALATVSATGVVTGVAAGGPVTITATSEGQSGTGAVTVTAIPVASVTVSPGSSTVNVGATVQLTPTTKDANGNVLTGRVVTWTTSDAALVTVSSTGLVTGVAAGGPVTITATSEAQSGTAAVTVLSATFNLTSLAAGFYHTCGLTSGGAAYCWGWNSNGQLGDGTTTDRLTPTPVAGGLTFTSLAPGGGFGHTCGLTSGGAAYCWGYNGWGQLGDGTTTDRLTPTPVAGGLTFASITAGEYHTCGLTSGGTAYCWGNNDWGQLGDGTFTTRLTPTPVAGGLTFTSLTAGGARTCGLTSGGTAYCWGYNIDGEVGDGTSGTWRLTPTPVAGGLTFTSLTAGAYHTCGLTSGGAAYCWGLNGYGELGDGTSGTDRLTPTPAAGGLAFAVLTAGNESTCGLTSGGAAYCWGDNTAGEVGDGTSGTDRLTPTPVAGGLTFTSLTAGSLHTCGLTSGGAAYCWGGNQYGDLGDGTATTRLTPTPVARP
jgi:alpha-tubulin suppressor-like RCC1 family protein